MCGRLVMTVRSEDGGCDVSCVGVGGWGRGGVELGVVVDFPLNNVEHAVT